MRGASGVCPMLSTNTSNKQGHTTPPTHRMFDPATEGLQLAVPTPHGGQQSLHDMWRRSGYHIYECVKCVNHTVTLQNTYDICSGYVLRIRIPNGVADTDKRDTILRDVMNTSTRTLTFRCESRASLKHAAELLRQMCGFQTVDPREDSSYDAQQHIGNALRPLVAEGHEGYFIAPTFEVSEADSDPADFVLDVPLLLNLVHAGCVVWPRMLVYSHIRMVFEWSDSVLHAVAAGDLFLSMGARNGCLCTAELRDLLFCTRHMSGYSLQPKLTRECMATGDSFVSIKDDDFLRGKAQKRSVTLTGNTHKPPNVANVTLSYVDSEYESHSYVAELVRIRDDALSASYSIEGVPRHIHDISMMVTLDAPTEEWVTVDIDSLCVVCRYSEDYEVWTTEDSDSDDDLLPLTFETHFWPLGTCPWSREL